MKAIIALFVVAAAAVAPVEVSKDQGAYVVKQGEDVVMLRQDAELVPLADGTLAYATLVANQYTVFKFMVHSKQCERGYGTGLLMDERGNIFGKTEWQRNGKDVESVTARLLCEAGEFALSLRKPRV